MEMHEAMVLEQTLEDSTAGGCGELESWVCRTSDPSPTEFRGGQTVNFAEISLSLCPVLGKNV